ncbi:hypothetical protein HMPREF9123_2866 [Neisseria bacilliformis ATCC BAA-1200]|uniref:Uncharacterized protein n=1 Tax=Neisseria bacilliformis ATCC BAA-1200 TaxID=888742 RepID=F2BGK9_9NEIS|nr:hypothetical protein HMPREF9123_2866 [Neisseria bacilliformis ATCC BAA-1200]
MRPSENTNFGFSDGLFASRHTEHAVGCVALRRRTRSLLHNGFCLLQKPKPRAWLAPHPTSMVEAV